MECIYGCFGIHKTLVYYIIMVKGSYSPDNTTFATREAAEVKAIYFFLVIMFLKIAYRQFYIKVIE